MPTGDRIVRVGNVGDGNENGDARVVGGCYGGLARGAGMSRMGGC